MSTQEDRLHESLAGLLPTGYAWPRAPESVLMGVIRGLAKATDAELDTIHAVVQRWQPTSGARLAEWEDSVDLPAAWSDPAATGAQRVAEVLFRLRGPELPYDDSCPSAPAVIEAECARLGYEAQVRYNKPARYGQASYGARFGVLNGVLWVLVDIERTVARYGQASYGARFAAAFDRLRYLEEIVPARFEIRITSMAPGMVLRRLITL